MAVSEASGQAWQERGCGGVGSESEVRGLGASCLEARRGQEDGGEGTWAWPATTPRAFLANSQACLLLALTSCFP